VRRGRVTVSEHPEVPRVEFNFDGESMNVEEAVERFRRLLVSENTKAEGHQWAFNVHVTLRPCDCDETLSGRDEYCPLHGDKS